MPKVYAFDVDECLEVSKGPVTVQSVRDLSLKDGQVVGLCGNCRAFITAVPDWYDFISFTLNLDFGFMGRSNHDKSVWLHCFQHCTYPNADEYIMVGNTLGRANK